MCSWDERNGLESQFSVVPELAILTSPGHLLEMQILRPHSQPTDSEIGAGAQQSGSSQDLQVGLVQLKFENQCSGGSCNSPKSSLHPALPDPAPKRPFSFLEQRG